jgi:hypothetical protein
MDESNATDEWLDQHPYIDFSKTDSDDGVVSVRIPIDALPSQKGRRNSHNNAHVQQEPGTEAGSGFGSAVTTLSSKHFCSSDVTGVFSGHFLQIFLPD